MVVAIAELHEPGIAIVEAAREPERLEARARVGEHVAEGVVVEVLLDRSRGRVHDQAHAADLIDDDAMERAALHEEGRGAAAAVDEAADHGAGAVELGDRLELTAVEEALHQHAVQPFADAAIEPVDDVSDVGAVGEG